MAMKRTKLSFSQGIGQAQDVRDFSNLASDDDSFTFELGLRCAKQTPIKKLLAKEMSSYSYPNKESGSKRSVVAKLMGLSDHPSYEIERCRSHTDSNNKDRHFKDVFEIVEPSNLTATKMAFKFMDANSKHPHCGHIVEAMNMHLGTKQAREPRSRIRHHARNTLNAAILDRYQAQPTRIIVLKPNLGKLLKQSDAVSECRKGKQIPVVKKREVHKCRESRELAKEITRQMRNSFSNNSSVRHLSTNFKGYAADESSCSVSGNELDGVSMSSKYSFDLNNCGSNHSRPFSSPRTNESSSLSREAKRRLSERWKKLNHRSQDMGMVGRGTTLAEMLAIPDKEKRPVVQSCRAEPLGISSRDGWKDGSIARLTRSRSLPSSMPAYGTPKAMICREDRYVMPKQAWKRERNKGHKSNLDKIRAVNNNSKASHVITESHNDTCDESHSRQNQEEIELEVNSLPEQKLEDLDSLSDDAADRNPVSKTSVDAQCETAISSKPLHDLLPESPSSTTLVEDARNEIERDNSNPIQEPQTEVSHEESPLSQKRRVPVLKSPASCKEADQPSPISVLEVPFTDDLSSCSECFGSLNADLQGLRMQLQLLKLESESYGEGHVLLSSDEEASEESTGFSLHKSQQSWESCYVVEALIHSCLDDADPDAFLASWHALDCPISPLVFEELEKNNYEECTSQPKSERKLLFDQINHAISEMYRRFDDPQPWVRSSTTLCRPKWSQNELQDSLFQFLATQEKTAKKDTTEWESQWLDNRDDVEVIGRDIEKLMLDELVGELVVI